MGADSAGDDRAGQAVRDSAGGQLTSITEKSNVAMTRVAASRERPSRIASLLSAPAGVIVVVASIIFRLSIGAYPARTAFGETPRWTARVATLHTKQSLCQGRKTASGP